ncbi:mismatch repair endonuclease PMS2-like isoform X2 [Scylla paramamosain]|uniref:mismatch repair endonuclease PMS2-like isoform X2 n=1 Tax=Scylla paramamosain TaxID=85552 RepID=UPI00308270AC
MEVDDGGQATTEAAKGIKAIDKTTVHRICSGQVVLTLAIGVKELVENSLDAGATSVEVRLKDHGATLLEVSDNGRGVEEHDFEGLTLKHHTSKIQDFGDVVGVKTFGFRGEALSSLCALSDLTITTRHGSSDVATKLTYDHNGKLISRAATSRQVGTTVSLQGLFSTLPVRHKEFLRNVKKEFNKMVQVLYGYCLISTGVRITCTNQNEKGKKTVVVSTSGHPTIRENLSSIFGAKQAASLLEFKQESASQDVLEEFGIPEVAAAGKSRFALEGLVSTCAHGQGRSSTDRQYYFINSRPCDPPKVMKLVNEIYHQYNRHQFPCVVLNIQLQDDNVDINVTPDKRQILVCHEKLLLATIKTSLLQLYEHIPSTYSMHNTSLTPTHITSPAQSPSTPTTSASAKKISALAQRFGRSSSGSPQPTTPPGGLSGLKRSFSLSSPSIQSPENKQPKLMSFLKKTSEGNTSNGDTIPALELCVEGVYPLASPAAGGSPHRDTEEECVQEGESFDMEGVVSSVKDGDALSTACDVQPSNRNSDPDPECDMRDISNSDPNSSDVNTSKSSLSCRDVPDKPLSHLNRSHSSPSPGVGVKSRSGVKASPHTPVLPASSSCRKIHSATSDFLNNLMARKSLLSNKNEEQKNLSVNEKASSQMECNKLEVIFEGVTNGDQSVANGEGGVSNGDVQVQEKVVVCDDLGTVGSVQNRKCKLVQFDIKSLRRKLRMSSKKDKCEVVRRFKAKISPTDNTVAEEELRKEISKDMFAEMEILGQFNLGFIITRLGQDLFIVDQHATDEKYNFETLQQTCVLQNQRLIAPQTLELTAIGEATLLDNLEIFRKNGYEFLVREEQPVGRRVSLVTMPVSRGWEFGRGDVEELIFMLSDAPGTMCRPSRVRAMFASRACRKSVMIGTALTHRQMKQLVTHMGEIEQPWNCPHGRPTMRHLVNLDMLVPLQSQE